MLLLHIACLFPSTCELRAQFRNNYMKLGLVAITDTFKLELMLKLFYLISCKCSQTETVLHERMMGVAITGMQIYLVCLNIACFINTIALRGRM